MRVLAELASGTPDPAIECGTQSEGSDDSHLEPEGSPASPLSTLRLADRSDPDDTV
jgi:hypothetical protein